MTSWIDLAGDGFILVLLLTALALGRRIVRMLRRLGSGGAEIHTSIARLEGAIREARAVVKDLRDVTREAGLYASRVDKAESVAADLDALVDIGGLIADRIEAAGRDAVRPGSTGRLPEPARAAA